MDYDTLGFGRLLMATKPAAIVVMTDGLSLVDNGRVSVLEAGAPGFYSSPFRWDQRVHGVVLRLPRFETAEGRVGDDKVSHGVWRPHGACGPPPPLSTLFAVVLLTLHHVHLSVLSFG